MSNFQHKYKQKCSGANDAATGRMIRVRQQDERRKVNRAENFSRNRDVSPIPQIQVPETRETSSLDVRFRRWKLEKELEKKMDQRNKKPIFKVGIVHHRFYSPLATDKTNDTPCHPRGAHRVKTSPSPPKRITRATQKRLAAKMAASVAAASSQSGTSGTALSITPSQPSTSGTVLPATSSQPSTSAAAACSTPFPSGTSTAAALASSFLSSTGLANPNIESVEEKHALAGQLGDPIAFCRLRRLLLFTGNSDGREMYGNAAVRQQDERRKVNRAENFSRNRDVSPIPQIQVPETQETSSLDVRFRRWKLEKELKRKMDQRNKKPIFKVGIVHHRFYSPLATDKTNDTPCHPRGAHRVKTSPSPPKRITRATQKRLAAKMAASVAAASSQPGTSGTALSITPSQPSTSGTVLPATPSQLSTSAAAACSTPFPSGTSTAAALASSFLSSTGVAAACPTPSQLGTRSAALSVAPFQPSTSAAAACVTPLRSDTSTTAGPSSSSLSSTSTTRPSTQKKAFPSAKKVPGVSFAPPTYAFKGPEGVKRMPMFGLFVISTSSSSESAHSSEVEAREELPWPSGSISLPSELPVNNSNRLRRQNAIGSPSWPASACFSSTDSLVEEKSTIIELGSPGDATKSQAVESENITMVETLTCSGSPSPAMFSPYVTTSRGKDCARRERRSKMGIGCTPPDDVPTKETVMRSLNISVEEEERTAQYFKFILQRETQRLNEICAKWGRVKGEPGLTEDARYLINQAIGQTTLLVRKKFERFRSLVADCETGKGDMLVQCRDLQGFWDMTYVEVKNCDSRFQKLDQLQSTGWVEEEIVLTTKRPTGIRKKVAANKFTMNAKSSARSWILAERKVMSRTEEGAADVISVRHNSEESRPATSGDTHSTPREKTRRSLGSSPRTVSRSAKRANMKITPKKTPASLLRKVQLSETKRHARSPLTVMKISQMCKTPDIRLDETISYVNTDQTPSRGILKKSDETTTTDIAGAKSTRKVDFNDVFPSEARTDENLENSIDLGRALARIESYDSDSSDSVFAPEIVSHKNVTLRRIAKHLDFENEFISKTSETDSSMTTEVRKLSTLIADITNEENHSEDESLTRRVLRNRTVSAGTPKKSTRRSTQSSSAREKIVELDSSVKENDDPQIPARRKSSSESSRIFYIAHHSEEPDKIRRSMRKSVRFNAEDCTGCADSSKPVHPITPPVRRSRKISLLGDDSRRSIGPAFDGDLISFDSPAVPSRIRRTSQASRKSTQ